MALDTKKVLVVEDEPDTAEMFAEMLRLRGYRVSKSYGSTSAMRQLTLEKPDAVVLDVMMPDISGLEVLHYIRREPAMESIPVIVVSAKAPVLGYKNRDGRWCSYISYQAGGIFRINQSS